MKDDQTFEINSPVLLIIYKSLHDFKQTLACRHIRM